MTTENQRPREAVPFLVRRSEPMGLPIRQHLRYDYLRQIAQVELNGRWVDAPDLAIDAGVSTRITRVQSETTDDE